MIEKLQNEIEKINENLNILPKKTKANKQKYLDYINDNIDIYGDYLKKVQEEIDNRYNLILNVTGDEHISDLLNEKYNFLIFKLINPNIQSVFKMDLDYLLYILGHYYKNNLNYTNEVIKQIINKFSSVNIKLVYKDFNYSEYVSTYMQTFLQTNDENVMHKLFDDIYWQCPELILQIKLNFKSIYLKNEKNINKYYIRNYGKLNYSTYINENNNKKEKLNFIIHNDAKYLLNGFINKTFLINDYYLVNINKLSESLLLDIESKKNYDNLSKLYNSLIEYKNYNKYQFIINDLKLLYSQKDSYKNIYQDKLKEINKKEKELFKLNNKILNKGIIKINLDKLGEFKLKVNLIVNEIENMYNELDDLLIKNIMFNYVNDDTSILEVLRLASSNYYYMAKIFKTLDDNMSIEEINDNIYNLNKFIYIGDFSILENISIIENKNIAQIISDRYKLANINIDESNLTEDQIDLTIKNISTLITHEDLKRNNLKVADIDFVLNVRKNMLKDKVL